MSHLLRSWPERDNNVVIVEANKAPRLSKFTDPADVVKESIEKTGRLILRGVMQRADALNQNGRVYPRSILGREVRNYQKFIIEHRALAELDHPDTSVVELKNACLNVIELDLLENGDVIGAIEVLWRIPSGQILRGLVEHGIKIGISSRGVGSTTQHGDYVTVCDDFQLVCFDAVSEPSTSGAFMLPEGLKLKQDELTEFKRVYQRFTSVDAREERRDSRLVHMLDEILQK